MFCVETSPLICNMIQLFGFYKMQVLMIGVFEQTLKFQYYLTWPVWSLHKNTFLHFLSLYLVLIQPMNIFSLGQVILALILSLPILTLIYFILFAQILFTKHRKYLYIMFFVVLVPFLCSLSKIWLYSNCFLTSFTY